MPDLFKVRLISRAGEWTFTALNKSICIYILIYVYIYEYYANAVSVQIQIILLHIFVCGKSIIIGSFSVFGKHNIEVWNFIELMRWPPHELCVYKVDFNFAHSQRRGNRFPGRESERDREAARENERGRESVRSKERLPRVCY